MGKVVNKFHTEETNFLKCGVIGWCFEVIWTGMHNFFNHDYTLTSSTSLLMFPIYGLAFMIKPISHIIQKKNIFIRGCAYTVLIYFVEYVSGMFLKKLNICPWDYSGSKYNIKGIIRLDYAPAWFTVGLIYEKMLNPHSLVPQKDTKRS